jgi:hypothetical protein
MIMMNGEFIKVETYKVKQNAWHRVSDYLGKAQICHVVFSKCLYCSVFFVWFANRNENGKKKKKKL